MDVLKPTLSLSDLDFLPQQHYSAAYTIAPSFNPTTVPSAAAVGYLL